MKVINNLLLDNTNSNYRLECRDREWTRPEGGTFCTGNLKYLYYTTMRSPKNTSSPAQRVVRSLDLPFFFLKTLEEQRGHKNAMRKMQFLHPEVLAGKINLKPIVLAHTLRKP